MNLGQVPNMAEAILAVATAGQYDDGIPLLRWCCHFVHAEIALDSQTLVNGPLRHRLPVVHELHAVRIVARHAQLDRAAFAHPADGDRDPAERQDQIAVGVPFDAVVTRNGDVPDRSLQPAVGPVSGCSARGSCGGSC